MSNQQDISTCTIKLDSTPWFRVQCSDDAKFRAVISKMRAIPNGDVLYATWSKTWICQIEHFETIKKILTQLYDECWLETDGKRERIKKVQAPQSQEEKGKREALGPEQMSLFG